MPDPQVEKSVVGPTTFLKQCNNFLGILFLQFGGHLLSGSMGVNNELPQKGLCHRSAAPKSLSLWQATADWYLHRRLKHRSGSVSAWSLGPGAHKVLFEPSQHLWWVWDLILNAILPLLTSCWGFSFALGHGVSLFGGIQQSIDACSAVSCNFGVLTGYYERTYCYSAIL